MHEALSVQVEIDATLLDVVLDTAVIEQVIRQVMHNEGQTGAWEVGIRITDDNELQRLNQQFRGIAAPTDVLSFGNDDDGDFVGPDGIYDDDEFADQEATEDRRYLGDLAISYERVVAQASEYGHSVTRELYYLIAHGALHLLGYDHESEAEREAMRQREEAALVALGITREYGQ